VGADRKGENTMTTVKLNDFEVNFIWVALKARESEYLMKSGKRDENMEIAEEYRKLAEKFNK
jgi:hypothetical protein